MKIPLHIVLPGVLFLPLYWQCISGRGFGGLIGLLLSPIVLALCLGAGIGLRRKLGISAPLHLVDFLGLFIFIPIAYLFIPTIR